MRLIANSVSMPISIKMSQLLSQGAAFTIIGHQKPRGSLVFGWQEVKDTLSQNYFRKSTHKLNLQILGLAMAYAYFIRFIVLEMHNS
jgi:hypothetical protein